MRGVRRQLVPFALGLVPLLGCPVASPPGETRAPAAARTIAAPREPAGEAAARESPDAAARERRWSAPVDLDAREGDAKFPKIAMDAKGNAMVAWSHDGEGRSSVHVRRFESARARWESPQTFATPDRDSHVPQIAMTRAGAAVLVWTEYDHSSNGSAEVARYAPTAGWSDRAALAPWQPGSVFSPSVAIHERGDIVAVWERDSGERSSVHSNRFDAAGGAWSGAEPREQNRFDNRFPSVALDDVGNAIAAWTHYRKSAVVIHAARFDAATGAWRALPTVTNRRWNTHQPIVTMGPRGAAWITWHSRRPSPTTPVFVNTWERVFVDAWDPSVAQWERALQLGSDSAGVREGRLLRDDAALVAVWSQAVDEEHHLRWRTLDADARAWSEPAAIDAQSTGSSSNIELASDGAGNVLVAWERHHDGRSDLFVSRLDHGAGRWSTPTMLDTEEEAHAQWPAIAAAVDGTAIVVWTEASDDGSRLHTRRFE